MVLVLPENPSFGAQFARNFTGGISKGMDKASERNSKMQLMKEQARYEQERQKDKSKSDLINELAVQKYKNDERQKMVASIEGNETNSQLEQLLPQIEEKLGFKLTADQIQSVGQQLQQGQGPEQNQMSAAEPKIDREVDPFLKAKKYAAIGEKPLADIAAKEAESKLREKRENKKEVTESFNENSDFINKSYDMYEDALRKDAIIERGNQLNESNELSDSGTINLLESLGLDPQWLKNPANEEYTKLALDLLGGGTLQTDYGSRVLASEFKVSQQRIPSLSQTKEGRRQIAENIKTMLLPAKLKKERLQFYLDQAERTGKPLPHNLRGKILQDIKPQLEEAYDKFKQRNGRYEVRKGTMPDDDALEKYYYLSEGKEDKAMKMMKEDGYDIES
jgi:hypothetical protein